MAEKQEQPQPQLVPDAAIYGLFHLAETAPGEPEWPALDEEKLCALWNAAPDLLAALDTLQACFYVTADGLGDSWAQAATDGQVAKYVNEARTAIAKARGKSVA